MRLIDGDALEKAISVSHSMTDDYGIQTGYVFSMKLIEDAPTIELRCEECEAFNKTRLLVPQPERKKGKWIPQDFNKHYGMTSTAVYYYPKCSMCGESANYTNFCPKCGADMRGDENDQSKR